MSAHTATPWIAQLSTSGNNVITAGNRTLIAEMVHAKRLPARQTFRFPGCLAEHHANAEFIVRAVNSYAELLDALEGAADALGLYPMSIEDDSGEDCESAYQHACAAVAKARGLAQWAPGGKPESRT